MGRRLRLGMVGGGEGAFIGAVHRMAARMDDRWELVAGCFSRDAARGRRSAAALHVAPDRTYADWREMARAEAARSFAPEALRGRPQARQEWAVEQLRLAARASRNLGLAAHASFSGALAWPFVYPWPQRPAGLVETAFAELARRWRPILDTFEEHGVDLCYEIHPGEDLHDGATFERFLEAVGNHPRCNILYDPSHFVLQALDHVAFLDIYHSRIRAFHAKDAEFRPDGRVGVYGGYLPWVDRAGRFRSLGDGQVDFKAVFSKLAQYGYAGWAVLEWECCLKHPEDGAREGAAFIRDHIIRVTDKAFDDFAASGTDEAANRRMLGIG